MSLATSIKDFSDTVNSIYTLKSSLPILPFLQEILLFIAKTILSGSFYILTFEWFREISYLPVLNPASVQQFELGSAEHLLFPNLGFLQCHGLSLDNSGSHLLSLSSVPQSTANNILSGLINSFFFSLPFSLPHLISIRRLFSQGIHAALASLLGTVAAHSLCLLSILFGLRSLVIPWFTLEPVTYLLGFFLNVLVIKELIQTSPQRFQQSSYRGTSGNTTTDLNTVDRLKSQLFGSRVPLEQKQRGVERTIPFLSLLRIGFLSFGLTWCEELNVFSSISHLTLDAQNSYLDLYASTNTTSLFIVNAIYGIAFVVGSCTFSILFYYLLLKSGPAIASWTNLSSTRVNATINRLVMLFILTFTFASFPYYGLDYLIGKVGGFLPEDPIYKESVLSPTKITVNKKNTLFIKAESADKKKHSSLLDINNFDNGVYLHTTDFNKLDNFPSDSKNSISRTTSFEKSNYRQENAWIRRNYLARLRARPRKNSENSSTASFYKAFKDPKAYYQKIQLEADRKQSKSMRDMQAKSRSGYSVNRQEGVLAKESTFKRENFWDRILGFPRDNVLQTLKKRADTNESKAFVETGTQSKPGFDLIYSPDTLTVDSNNVGISSINSQLFTDSTQTDDQLDLETNIFAEKYTKGVKQKSSAPFLKRTKSLSTKNIIKRKFFLNPVYRSLLQTDIDAFMARQPAANNIAENQEYDLYKKRFLLERYYNWLRYYSPLQSSLQDLYNISETKSFVGSVFHHQFKGTLKIAKRLFPVTFDSQQNSKKNRVVSYDQTLYKNEKGSENPFLHEELVSSLKPNDTKARLVQRQDLSKSPNQAWAKHDTLTSQKVGSPFIEESDTSPFYAGWDDTLRRFVITNRFFVEK